MANKKTTKLKNIPDGRFFVRSTRSNAVRYKVQEKIKGVVHFSSEASTRNFKLPGSTEVYAIINL